MIITFRCFVEADARPS